MADSSSAPNRANDGRTRDSLKELPFPIPPCEECDHFLQRVPHRGLARNSKRAGQKLYRLQCGNPDCARLAQLVYFTVKGKQVALPTLTVQTPFERPPCTKCGRRLTFKRINDHPTIGRRYGLLCNVFGCALHNKIFWFDQRGVVVDGPTGRTRDDLPMEREICPTCNKPKTASYNLHKPSARRLWLQQCRRPGCSSVSSWYDDNGKLVSLKTFQGWKRKYVLPLCPNCSTDSVRVISKFRGTNLENLYARCKTCNRKFAWDRNKPDTLRPVGGESGRSHNLKPTPFPRPQCPWPSCGANLDMAGGPRRSERRGQYWEFRCTKCLRYSWSNDGVAHKCQPRRNTRTLGKSKGGRKKKTEDQKWFFRIGQMFEGELPRCRSGRTILSGLQKRYVMAQEEWKNGLVKARYSDIEVAALLAARTAVGAAQLCVALTLKVNVKSVRVACSKFHKLKHTPSPAPHKD